MPLGLSVAANSCVARRQIRLYRSVPTICGYNNKIYVNPQSLIEGIVRRSECVFLYMPSQFVSPCVPTSTSAK